MRTANLALAFFLELAGWGALAYGAAQLVAGTVAQLVVGIIAFAVVIGVWAQFVAPRARTPLPPVPHEILKDVILGLGVVALLFTGHALLAGILAALLLLNRGLAYVWEQGW